MKRWQHCSIFNTICLFFIFQTAWPLVSVANFWYKLRSSIQDRKSKMDAIRKFFRRFKFWKSSGDQNTPPVCDDSINDNLVVTEHSSSSHDSSNRSSNSSKSRFKQSRVFGSRRFLMKSRSAPVFVGSRYQGPKI